MQLKKTPQIKVPFPNNNFFVMLTKHKTSHGMCGWYTKKDGFIGEFASKLNTLKMNRNLSIKFLHGDNASKNKSFLKETNGKDWRMGVTPKWTPCTTPQPNCVKNPIYVIMMRAHALLAAANVPDDNKNILLPYAVKYA